jgi:hypothetical protein
MGGMELVLGLVSVAGQALGAIGSYQAQNAQAEAQRRSAEMAAEAEMSNARLAAINEDIARNQGTEAQADAYTEGYKAMGRQRAVLAQSGLISSPTGLLLQQETENAVAQDQNRIGLQAEMNALGYTIQGANAVTNSSVHKANAASAQGGSKLGLVGGLLGAAASGFGTYANYGGGGTSSSPKLVDQARNAWGVMR